MRSLILKKLRWKGLIAVAYGEPTRVTCKAIYYVWKKYFLHKIIVAYGTGRITQTAIAVSFPKWTAKYGKFDTCMVPVFLQGLARCLATRDDLVFKGLAAGLGSGAFLSYKGVYGLTQAHYVFISMMAAEVLFFGEPVFITPSLPEGSPLKHVEQVHDMFSLCHTLMGVSSDGWIPNFLKAHFEIARAQKVLAKSFFVPNTQNERVIALSKIVVADTAYSSLSNPAFGPTYSTGIAVVTALNTLGF